MHYDTSDEGFSNIDYLQNEDLNNDLVFLICERRINYECKK
jgi:hypothetical protein